MHEERKTSMRNRYTITLEEGALYEYRRPLEDILVEGFTFGRLFAAVVLDREDGKIAKVTCLEEVPSEWNIQLENGLVVVLDRESSLYYVTKRTRKDGFYIHRPAVD